MSQLFKPGAMLFDKYEVLDIIGKGGFGVVYKAFEPQLKRTVAIKTLLYNQEELSEAYGSNYYNVYLSRFRQEATVSSYFTRNPHIITVYNLERDSEQNYFLVLEYIDGGSLSGLIKREKRLSIKRACDISWDICLALADIHSHEDKIVHRDLKPSNILLRGNGEAVVADFGIAQVGNLSMRSVDPNQRHPGTAAYMSPEQASSGNYLTPVSDLFSLGMIIYEMLTGQIYDRVKKASPNSKNGQVPAWLDALVMKLLQENPEDRYQQAEEVLEVLQAKMDGDEEEDATRPLDYATKKVFRPIPRQAEKPVSEAERETQMALHAQRLNEAKEQQTRLAQYLSDVLSHQLQQAEASADWDKVIELGERILGLDDSTQKPLARSKAATAYSLRGMNYYNQNKYEPATTDLNRAIELEPTQANHYYLRSLIYLNRRNFNPALTDLNKALELNQSQPEYFYSRGLCYLNLNQLDAAVADFTRAIQLDSSRVSYFSERAKIYFMRGQFQQAIEDYDKVIQLAPNRAEFYARRGKCQSLRGFYDKAITDFSKAIQLDRNWTEYYRERGMNYSALGFFKESLADLDTSIRLEPKKGLNYFLRGQVNKARGDRQAARQDFQRAVELNFADAQKELTNL